MKLYPNEELDRMSKREIIRLYKRTVEQFGDAVSVIRCKDCKWFVDEEDQSYCIEMYGQCDGNGFCAWAERRTDETD